MHLFQYIVIALYALVAVYFMYLSALGIFVYFSNKSMGHAESFSDSRKYIILALSFSAFAVLSWFLLRNPHFHTAGLIIFFIPIAIIALYLLWVIIHLISAGGKWN